MCTTSRCKTGAVVEGTRWGMDLVPPRPPSVPLGPQPSDRLDQAFLLNFPTILSGDGTFCHVPKEKQRRRGEEGRRSGGVYVD